MCSFRISSWSACLAKMALSTALVYAATNAEFALAARTVLFEDFEDETPGDSARAGQIESIDLYQRSSVTGPSDPSDALISGGAIPDPFAPGNKSLILYNPEATTQMAANFYDFFDADPAQFRNGVIEFDLFMDTLKPDSYWTFLDIRFGFDTDGPRVVTTTNDATIWTDIRIQDDGVRGADVPNVMFERRTTETYADQEVIVPARKMRVRYDINGGAVGNPNPTFSVSIDNLESPDAPVVVTWPGGNVKPWFQIFNFNTFQFEPAPGINVISFLTDASANALGDSSQNIFIDNLRVINNDLPPLAGADFNGNGFVDGADFLAFQRGFGIASGATFAQGDADGNQMVDAADFDIFKQQFGQPAAVGAGATVPEPISLASSLAAACFAVLVKQGRRQSGALATT